MDSDTMRTSSDSEAEVIQDAIDDDDDDDVRYSLRSRRVPRTQAPSVTTSSELGGVVVTRSQLETSTRDLDVEDGQDGGRTTVRPIYATSPFEMMPTRCWMSAGPRPTQAHYTATSVYADVGVTSRMQDRARVLLPFQLDRRDIPYVPPRIQQGEAPALTSISTARTTTRVQEQIVPGEDSRARPTDAQQPTWAQYHQQRAQQMIDGRRAIERIARGNAVDPNDEPDIYLDPHPLLDGGRAKADRFGPESSIFESRRPPVAGSGAARRGPPGQEFDTMLDWILHMHHIRHNQDGVLVASSVYVQKHTEVPGLQGHRLETT
jgi:hypothetical protein